MAAVDETVRFGDELVIYGVVRNGVTMVRQGANALRIMGHHRDEAVILRVCPVSGTNAVDGDVLTGGTPFYLRSRDGDYFQRTTLMYDDQHWRCGRFALGFADHASQTAQIYGVHGEVRYGQELGISFAGSVEDRTHPDTNKRRYLSLLPECEPTCVVDVWDTDERLVLALIQRQQKQHWFK
eukprot:TRINITY_DN3772_c0_g2_i1.p1 TRINITY_DN3772_c0_g2~~TRINITY_DN3772_c0_g2_i1.p1  ORF type:complete len:182 (-),score=41.32 TRINITY_DN3772_c0_g2_i1:32-577(-)